MSAVRRLYPNGNGNDWSDKLKRELAYEEDEIAAGRAENAIFTQALAENWSVAKLREVARYKGRSWRFVSALADAELQIEGYAVLDFVALAVGEDMALHMAQKTFRVMARVNAARAASIARHGENPLVDRLADELLEDLLDWNKRFRDRYAARCERLLR